MWDGEKKSKIRKKDKQTKKERPTNGFVIKQKILHTIFEKRKTIKTNETALLTSENFVAGTFLFGE